MPKVYLNEADRQEQRIRRVLTGICKESGYTAIGEAWCVSKSAVCQRLANGNVTLLDLWKIRDIARIDEKDIKYLIGGDEK